MSRTLLFLVAATIATAPAATSQPEDAPPAVALSFWRCDRSAMGDLIQADFERALPINQSFVDSGRIWETGTMVHAWGDEYNFVSYIVAPDIATIHAASGEMNDAYQARYPDDNSFLEHCTEHFDNIYTAAVGNGFTGSVSPDNPATVALSFWKCPLTEVGRLMEQERGMPSTIVEQLTEEGVLRGSGFMTHAWGDTWNVVRYAAADDFAGIEAGFDALNERLEAADFSDERGINQTCSAHRDNIYEMVVRTTPRAE